MSSIKQIADEVGISSASVSIYLNDKTTNRVSNKTKVLIDQAVKKLNYHKNIFASSLSTQKSKIIGIIIPSLNPLFRNEYTNFLLSGIQSTLSAYNYNFLFFSSTGTSSIEVVKEQLEKSAGCDGFILFSTGFCTQTQSDKNIFEVIKTGKPFVTINVPYTKDDINQILIDGLERSLGVQYLIDKGHRDILVILGRKAGAYTHLLKEDAIKLFNNNGINYEDNQFLYGDFDDHTSYNIVKAALKNSKKTSAICCMSDIMAAGALKACKELHLRVPKDISIIGRNNTPLCNLLEPTLTTVDLHMLQAGTSAAQVLLNIFSGNSAPQKMFIKSTIIERSSTQI